MAQLAKADKRPLNRGGGMPMPWAGAVVAPSSRPRVLGAANRYPAQNARMASCSPCTLEKPKAAAAAGRPLLSANDDLRSRLWSIHLFATVAIRSQQSTKSPTSFVEILARSDHQNVRERAVRPPRSDQQHFFPGPVRRGVRFRSFAVVQAGRAVANDPERKPPVRCEQFSSCGRTGPATGSPRRLWPTAFPGW
jgi:hypothetical protein